VNIPNWLKTGFALLPATLLFGWRAGATEHMVAPLIVTRYCSGCHGIDGNSQLPYIPRLAGLSADYTMHKFANFRAASSSPVDEAIVRIVRSRNVKQEDTITSAAKVHMVGVVRAVSQEDLRAAAEWFAAQAPHPGRTGDQKRIEAGRNLFLNGKESRRLTACQSCHGRDALGTLQAPRLAGQNAAYVRGQLALFRTGYPQNSPEMTEVARNIETSEVWAVAEFLQTQGSAGSKDLTGPRPRITSTK
jgi:cytochrome c553